MRRWLGAFGPGTLADLRWWTGWTMGRTRAALARVGPAEVNLGGEAGLVLAGDLEPEAAPDPWVALLPALDATPMGWSERGWFLGEHRAPLFDRSGNIGPTIWSDGRVVGGWAQRASGEIATRLLEDVGADARAGIDAAAARMAGWIGEIRFTPRFRTPLERELSALITPRGAPGARRSSSRRSPSWARRSSSSAAKTPKPDSARCAAARSTSARPSSVSDTSDTRRSSGWPLRLTHPASSSRPTR